MKYSYTNNINFIWFNLGKKNDLDIVMDFIINLPRNFNQLFHPKYSNLLRVMDEYEGKEFSKLIVASFRESKEILDNFIIPIKKDIYSNTDKEQTIYYRDKYWAQFKDVGFTGNSLKLKAKYLNKLGELIHDITKEVLDFTKDNFLSAITKFLRILNIILNSICGVIPQLHPLIELKEIIEKFIDFMGSAEKLYNE